MKPSIEQELAAGKAKIVPLSILGWCLPSYFLGQVERNLKPIALPSFIQCHRTVAKDDGSINCPEVLFCSVFSDVLS